MSMPLLGIVREPLSLDTLSAGVASEARTFPEGYGALTTFVGVVRATHAGRRVRYLEYEAFVPLAEKVLRQIAQEVRAEWPDTALGIVHRIGRLDVGEASVMIVAAAAHRGTAFAACRYAIERVKQIVPVWKHEFFEDGDAWVEGALADPSDDRARREALERSCA